MHSICQLRTTKLANWITTASTTVHPPTHWLCWLAVWLAKDISHIIIINWLKRSAFHLITHVTVTSFSLCVVAGIHPSMGWMRSKRTPPRRTASLSSDGLKPITFRIGTLKNVTPYHARREGASEWVLLGQSSVFYNIEASLWKLIRSIKVSTADLDCSTEGSTAAVLSITPTNSSSKD